MTIHRSSWPVLDNLSMALGVATLDQRFENPRELLGDRLAGDLPAVGRPRRHGVPRRLLRRFHKDSVRGRPTVPARVLATTMVLQAHEGLSDHEACDRLERDLAWQAAAGVHTAAEAFHPTLVGQHNRLRASGRPRRLFEDTKVVAKSAGLMGRRVRVLESTPIYDWVATQDTVTQLRSAIRKVLLALDRHHANWPPGCGAHCVVTTTTPGAASQRATGTTPRPESRWSTPCP